MENVRRDPTPARSPDYPWKLFWLLLAGSILGVAAALPYVYAIFGNLIARGGKLPMPLPILVTAQLMQSAIVFGGIIALGIFLAGKVGIETPILQAWLYRRADKPPRGWLSTPLLWGIVIGGLTFLLFCFVFVPLIPAWPLEQEAALPVWKRFLVCIYGAVSIELLMRFFLLSLFLWLLAKISRRPSLRPGIAIFWTANLLAAMLYAAGHIPAAKSLLPLTPIVLTAILLPAGLAGLAFGYLTWKRGLEAAMLAHFSADFIMHVLGPMVLR
jgi:MFS family permease